MKKKKRKIRKMILITLLSLIGIIVVMASLYLNFSPQVGGESSQHDSKNFKGKTFQNLVSTPLYGENQSFFKVIYEFIFKKSKKATPNSALPTLKIDKEALKNVQQDQVSVTWLGHSTNLIVSNDTVIITDPILHNKRIPPMEMGPKPFPYEHYYRLENLPKIDVVLISHDHYDHLDMQTVKQLKDSIFYVPLGVKAHLLRWGVQENNIVELDWYQDHTFSNNLKFTFTPARHFSGRGLFDRNKTLWGSWVIRINDKRIFFGGDSGYFEVFKTIGDKYGPFDMAMLDTGQYNKAWQNVHMMPQEVVQATMDLKTKTFMPIHNSKYSLALHAWYGPLEDVTKEAVTKGIHVTTPKIGQSFLLDRELPTIRWWQGLMQEQPLSTGQLTPANPQ